MSASNTFTCSKCGGTFEKGWSDEEALAEKNSVFGGHAVEDCKLICDDCYQRFMLWFRADEVSADEMEK